MLSNLAAFSHKELNAFLVSSLLCVATSVLRCLLRLRLIFRTSSAKTLLTMPLSHIAYASQFLPLRQNPCEQLEVLRISADRWAKVWQGKLRVPAALPSVHTAPCSLPPSFLSEVFQDTYVALYKKACYSYHGKKATGPDLWEVGLLGALPDRLLFFFFVVCIRLSQWRGRWPSWYLAFMAMIPKPDRDNRSLPRLLCNIAFCGIIRKPLASFWGICEVEDWDYCRRGRSALDAAFGCPLSCEVPIRTGEHCGVLLWDIETRFNPQFLMPMHLPSISISLLSF